MHGFFCTARYPKKKAQKKAQKETQKETLEKGQQKASAAEVEEVIKLLAESDMSYESFDFPRALHHVHSTPERVLKKANEDRSRHDASPIITRSTVISKATVSEHGWFAGKPCPLNEKHFDLKSLHGKADESDEDKVVLFDDLKGAIEMMPIEG